MNETVSKILEELNSFPLHFAFAYTEQNSQGEDILVFTCRELPLRDFIYIPGKKGMTLGWDTKQCPMAPAVLAEFRRYYEEEANWKVKEILEDIAYDRKKLEGDLSDRLEQKEKEQVLHETVAGLEEPERSVFILRYFGFYRIKEIAKRQGLTNKKVENCLYRGKEKLRKALIRKGIER